MNDRYIILGLIITLIGLGVIAYKENKRCTAELTPSCHYTLRERTGPL